jgi:hypothetical protein
LTFIAERGNYKKEREFIKKCIALGFPGTEPSVMGTYEADKTLLAAQDYYFKIKEGKP